MLPVTIAMAPALKTEPITKHVQPAAGVAMLPVLRIPYLDKCNKQQLVQAVTAKAK